MKKIIMGCMFILLLLNCTFSQELKKGYVIQNDGDTLNGYIQTGSLSKMCRVCRFKDDPESKKRLLYPEDIQAYRIIDGRYYVRRKVMLEGKPKVFFLEYLVDGEADLFYLKSGVEDHFFIENERDSIFELVNTQEIRKAEHKNYFVDKKEYLGILNYMFRDARDIQSQIYQTDLNFKSLMNITKTYHDKVCEDSSECIVYKRKNELSVYLGAVVGVTCSKVIHNKWRSYRSDLSKKGYGYIPAFNSSLIIRFDKIFGMHENMSFNAQLGYREIIYGSKSIQFRYSNIFLPVYLSYYYPAGALRPFINFGVNTSAIFNVQAQYVEKIEDPVYVSGLLGLGLDYQYKRFSYFIFGNYELNFQFYRVGYDVSYYCNKCNRMVEYKFIGSWKFFANDIVIQMGVRYDLNSPE